VAVITTGSAPKDISGGTKPMAKTITAAQRRRVPAAKMGLPGHGKGPHGVGPGDYPLDTKKRARSALSRIAAHGSSGEKATIRRKVKRLYPSIEVAGSHAHHAPSRD